MAKAEKYRINFKTGDNYDAQISFFYEGYAGSVITLIGAARPFVLREFNTDEDLYKPIRPQLAEMEILASSSGVTLDDFIASTDDFIEVRFYYVNLASPYWIGYLLQEDFEEEWINTNHIIKVTATDGFGLLKFKKLNNNGAEVTGKQTILDIIKYATQGLPVGWTNFTVINNLYHTSMSSTLPATCLTQGYLDSKTFEETPTLYSDNYKVLEQINKSYNQTIFMYNGEWFILRLEELYTPTTTNLRGYRQAGVSTTNINRRYDIPVGKNRTVKLISPEMLRVIKRMTKEDVVTFNYERFAEIISNSSFARGALLVNYTDFKDYDITDWTIYADDVSKTALTVPTAGQLGGRYLLKREIYLTITGPVFDSYAVVPQVAISPAVSSVLNRDLFMGSLPVSINVGTRIRIEFDHRFAINFLTKETCKTAYVRLYNTVSTNIYSLTQEGKWVILDPLNLGEDPGIDVVFNGNDGVIPIEWNTSEVESDPIPELGSIQVFLVCPRVPWANGQSRYFKGLKFEVLDGYDASIKTLTGVKSIFTKPNNLRITDDREIYFDDTSKINKGALYRPNQTDLTDKNWYRFRYGTERHGFRDQNAIAHWSHNRFDRNKIDANFFGLLYETGASTQQIGIMNTVVLVDDDPNKVYGIVSINEIDFASATWSATLEEVWDNSRDGGNAAPKSVTLNVKTGFYNMQAFVPFNSSNNADFIFTGDNRIYYIGATQIVTPVVISLAGNFITTTGAFPVATEFRFKKNGVTIATETVSVTANPQSFSILPAIGNVTINTNDYFEIEYLATQAGKVINEIQFTSGSFFIASYTIPKALDYDSYSERYTYS